LALATIGQRLNRLKSNLKPQTSKILRLICLKNSCASVHKGHEARAVRFGSVRQRIVCAGAGKITSDWTFRTVTDGSSLKRTASGHMKDRNSGMGCRWVVSNKRCYRFDRFIDPFAIKGCWESSESRIFPDGSKWPQLHSQYVGNVLESCVWANEHGAVSLLDCSLAGGCGAVCQVDPLLWLVLTSLFYIK